MNTINFATGSTHYIHLADPSEEGTDNHEEPKARSQFHEDNALATKLTVIASRGTITSEEYAQLANYVMGR